MVDSGRMRDGDQPKFRYSSNPTMFSSQPIMTVFVVGLSIVGVALWVMKLGPFIVGPMLIAFSAMIVCSWALSALSYRLYVTDDAVVSERGLLSRSKTRVAIASIRSVSVRQSLTDRMFNVGTVSVSTIGDEPEIVARGMPEPAKLEALLRN